MDVSEQITQIVPSRSGGFHLPGRNRKRLWRFFGHQFTNSSFHQADNHQGCKVQKRYRFNACGFFKKNRSCLQYGFCCAESFFKPGPPLINTKDFGAFFIRIGNLRKCSIGRRLLINSRPVPLPAHFICYFRAVFINTVRTRTTAACFFLEMDFVLRQIDMDQFFDFFDRFADCRFNLISGFEVVAIKLSGRFSRLGFRFGKASRARLQVLEGLGCA